MSEKKSEKDQRLKPSDFQITRASDYKIVYANSIRVGMSTWDIQMGFGRLDTIPDPTRTGPATKIEDLVGVVITPTNAKVLATILKQIVDDYEEAFGKLEMRSDLLLPVDMDGNLSKD